jgi:hypothetical protein
MQAAPDGGEQPLAVGLLATVTPVRRYLFVARRCRFTYSHSRFVMPDGGIGALPNSDSSVSVHPLKHTSYPPNGTLFGAFAFRFALVFAIVSYLPVSGGLTVPVAVRSLRAQQGRRRGWRSLRRRSRPPENQDQRPARFRRDSADFLPAARAAARFSAEVTRHRPQT